MRSLKKKISEGKWIRTGQCCQCRGGYTVKEDGVITKGIKYHFNGHFMYYRVYYHIYDYHSPKIEWYRKSIEELFA